MGKVIEGAFPKKSEVVDGLSADPPNIEIQFKDMAGLNPEYVLKECFGVIREVPRDDKEIVGKEVIEKSQSLLNLVQENP